MKFGLHNIYLRLILLHGVKSKSLNKADIVTSVETEIYRIRAKVSELEAIQTVVTQVAIQAATVAVMK